MKKLKNLFAIITLVGVLSLGNAFAGPITTPGAPNPRPVVSSYSVSSFFDSMYDYFKGLFAGDDNQAASEQGSIPPGRKGKNVTAEQGNIPPTRTTLNIGVIVPNKP